MEISLSELVELVGGDLIRAGSSESFTGFASLKEARPDEISFFGNDLYAGDLAESDAGAIFVPENEVDAPAGASLIRVKNPVMAFDAVVRKFGADLKDETLLS